MTTLTPDQIARYALGAGFGIGDGTVAVAVALAESGGDPNAHATKGEDSRGLWQINVLAHPDYADQDLYQPAVNAKAAFTIYKAQGWRPWTTYTSGKYLLYLPLAEPGMTLGKVAGPLLDPIDNTVAGAADKAGSVISDAVKGPALAAAALQDLESPQTWLRVAKVLIGGLLIIVAIRIFIEPYGEAVVKKVAPVAKALA